MQEKLPEGIPDRALGLQSASLDIPGQSLHVVSLLKDGQWSLRLVQPDAPFADRPAVAGRVWTTEIALARYGDALRLGVRVICASLPYARQEEIALTRPGAVLDVANGFDLRDVRPIDGKPWRLETDNDLWRFEELLTNWRRGLPVYLLTQPDERRLGIRTSPFLLDEDYLARKLQGLGHVATMPRDLGYRWTEYIGKSWSAFQGAVRTYQPGLMFEEDGPGEHPLALPEKILAFAYNGERAERGFASFLIDRAKVFAASKAVEWPPCLFHAEALQKEAEFARAATSDQAEWRQLYEQEIVALRERTEEADGLAASYASDVDQLKKQLESEEAENGKLRVYIETVRQQLESKTGKSADAAITFPDTYDELGEWVERNLAGRLILHPRADRGLKDAVYEDIELAYKSLLALSREYRDMRRGLEGARERWEATLVELGLRLDRSITETRAGEQGDEYYVRYPFGTDNRQLLESHLCKGNGRDSRTCLRIYFFWDFDKERVVVGWLPSHLDTRMT